MVSFYKTKHSPQRARLQYTELAEEALESVVGGVGAGEEEAGPAAPEQMKEQTENVAGTETHSGGIPSFQEDETQKLLGQMEELSRQSVGDMPSDSIPPEPISEPALTDSIIGQPEESPMLPDENIRTEPVITDNNIVLEAIAIS